MDNAKEMEPNFLTDEEVHAYVQYECRNREYFKLSQEQFDQIKEKIDSSDLHKSRYQEAKKVYLEVEALDEEKKSINPLPLMAAAISLIAVSVVSFFLLTSETEEGLIVLKGEELQALQQTYPGNQILDDRVFNPLRSSTFQVKQPLNHVRLETAVSFIWENQNEGVLTLKVRDTKNKMVFEKESVVSPYEWVIPENGVYYWTLENEEEILHWGKFFAEMQ